MEEAVEHCGKGVSIWPQFSTDEGDEPDVVMACCGDIPTQETLAAIDLLLRYLPDLKIRCVNVVDMEKGNIDTPLELAIRNQTDRFSLAIDAIDHMPKLQNRGASAREKLKNEQRAAANEAYENGSDPEYLTEWKWSGKHV
ncbi:hypothetical protein SLS62_008855 [Diatrype stigma]|uniref:Xylulose 5-phosphate/Fructose 6-phosphate phosphoketolase C-terminal domain-containing protein n=1 Tax=Diatrype stigma TaxID=117547 RepID=A0AAN9UGB4_9PEZI